MNALLAHIEAENAKTRAWVAEDPSNRWASEWSTDLETWAEIGVHTPEDLERYSLENEVYEMTKDLYHYRPSGLKEMTLEQLREEATRLGNAMHEHLERERDEQAAAHNRFVGRLTEIRQLVSGSSYEDAVRILCDAEDISADEISFYGWESLEWKLGLKFGSVKQFLAEINQLEAA